MKILLLADGIETSSLSEPGLWLHELIEHWTAAGHRLHVVCTGPLEPWQEPEDPPQVTVLRPGEDALEATLGELLALEPDVIHVAGTGPFGPRVLEILSELPVLLDVHDFWPICPNLDLLRRPNLIPCGEHYPFQGCGPCAGLSRLRAMESRVALAASARLILAHSSFTRVRLNAGLGRPIELVEYGVNTSRFRSQPETPQSSALQEMLKDRDRLRVLFLGPPSHARGADRILDLLVAVRARLPEVEFVIAGRDPGNPDWESVFRAESAEMGLAERTHVLPAVPASDMPALYAACRVAIAPVLAPEAGGLFILHAMAAGLPVVAGPLGAVQDLIRQGRHGLLVSPRDLAGFADAISSLLADPLERIAIGENARLEVVERHEFARAAQEIEELYHRLQAVPHRRAAA